MKHNILLFFVFITISISPAFCQCPTGDFSFYTQADIDAFGTTYAGCTNITLGNVTINGVTIANLDGLSNVTTITGYLDIVNNPGLSNLQGLKKLRKVDQAFLLNANPSLTDLTGLEDLGYAGELYVIDNAALTNLDGLNGLFMLGSNLVIAHNASLNDISGLQNVNANSIGGLGLTILENPQLSVCTLPNLCRYLSDTGNPRNISGNLANCLNEAAVVAACATACPWGNFRFTYQEDVDDFGTRYANCTNITLNDVTINGFYITNLDALNDIVKIEGNLNIWFNPLLNNLNGLSNITSIGTLSIQGNESLDSTGLSGLGNVTSVGQLNVFDNSVLPNLSGLGNLASITGLLDIEDNPALTSLGLSKLESIGDLYVSENPALTDFDLSGLKSIRENFFVASNSALSRFGLNKLESIGISFRVSGNPSLTSLDSLTALTSVGKIHVSGNSQLASITALNNIDLSAISALTITSNPALSLCNLPGMCAYLADPGNPRSVSGNTGSCSNATTLATTCTCPSGPYAFYSQSEIDEFGAKYGNCASMNLSRIAIIGDIDNLDGLSNLKGLEGLYLGSTLLTNLDGLSKLQGSLTYLEIEDNAELTNLNGLSGLTSIGEYFSILGNPKLTNVSGLKNADLSTLTGTGLRITNNPALSVCSLVNFCTYLSNDASSHPRTISGNLGDCADEAALQPACWVALPITLAGFRAVNEGRVNYLEWHTATEDQGDIFEIEHSVNGKKFKKIGNTPAKGIAGSHYSFMHTNPAAGINYYRLRFVNMDGSRGSSKIVGVKTKEDGFVMNAYPNPFTGNVQVSLGQVSEKAVITVSDASGRILQSETVNSKTHTLPLQHLRSGIYFIRYQDKATAETIKMVK
ncbi:Por secretion system C-terminal sorting domain-containing protein [Dyadobacter soli]|uniref:Por secretion system C-terminal sorting domain-containing protein n=2 Tax=Dyadobacter soli TaxID=659014 RepID=A0A1G7S7G5_9BACT|nr:Por secretion system C-terminal sorting domain-containing protein [Dyadobacter soli]